MALTQADQMVKDLALLALLALGVVAIILWACWEVSLKGAL